MRTIKLLALIALLAATMCACRMGNNNETTTVPTTVPTTTMPVPTTTTPIIPDPTIETNIPDTNVDDEHLIDTTGEGVDGTTDNTTPNIRRYID